MIERKEERERENSTLNLSIMNCRIFLHCLADPTHRNDILYSIIYIYQISGRYWKAL